MRSRAGVTVLYVRVRIVRTLVNEPRVQYTVTLVSRRYSCVPVRRRFVSSGETTVRKLEVVRHV